jgi:hypothetical protein
MRYKAHDPISIALVEQSNQVLKNELFWNELGERQVVSMKNRGNDVKDVCGKYVST